MTNSTNASVSFERQAQKRILPIVAINVRLKQLRGLALHRNGNVDIESFLLIYAEGLAQRYAGPPLRTVLYRDLKRCGLAAKCPQDEIDNACNTAEAAREAAPETSAWCTHSIGQALHVTLAERIAGFSHLGCCEETNEQRAARYRGRKAEQDHARRPGTRTAPSRESLKPWEAEGISRRTWYRKAKANSQEQDDTATNGQAHDDTKSARVRVKKKTCVRRKTSAKSKTPTSSANPHKPPIASNPDHKPPKPPPHRKALPSTKCTTPGEYRTQNQTSIGSCTKSTLRAQYERKRGCEAVREG